MVRPVTGNRSCCRRDKGGKDGGRGIVNTGWPLPETVVVEYLDMLTGRIEVAETQFALSGSA